MEWEEDGFTGIHHRYAKELSGQCKGTTDSRTKCSSKNYEQPIAASYLQVLQLKFD